MAVTMEICEEGRVLFLRYVDPVTLMEIADLFPANLAHRNSVPHTVHTLFDFKHFRVLPTGLLRARYAPVFTHPRSGKMVVIGATHLAHSVVIKTAGFTGNTSKLVFFKSDDEAWMFLRTAIDNDKQAGV
jgi:hypothetical protein